MWKLLSFISLTLIIIFELGCPANIQYDGSSRLKLFGKIIDSNGNPLKDIYVSLYSSKDYTKPNHSEEQELIKEIKTNNNGDFEFIFSYPDVDEFLLSINNFISEQYNNSFVINENYFGKTITFNIDRFQNYEFDISEYTDLDEGVKTVIINNASTYAEFIIKSKNNIILDKSSVYRQGNIYYNISPQDSMLFMQQKNSYATIFGYAGFDSYNEGNYFYDTLQIADQPYYYIIQ